MQTAASISLVLTDSSSFKRLADSASAISYGRFYQLIASGLAKGGYREEVFRELFEKLVVMAEYAHAFRELEMLEQISEVLVSLPLPRQYRAVGQYYQGVCTQKLGTGDADRAASLLEGVVEKALPTYSDRAIISLGANSRNQGDNQSALTLYLEAGRLAARNGLYDPYAIITAQRMVAVIHGEDGNHVGALALLDNLFPLAHDMRPFQPHVYYDYMNSLAVELCEVGRLEEAENVSRIVLASPFARAYPEWRETLEEIELRGRRPSRTTVAFSRSSLEAQNLVRMPVPARGDSVAVQPTMGTHPASVISLQEWKTKMPKQSNGDPQDLTTPKPGTDEEKRARLLELQKLTIRQKLLRIMEMLGDEGVTDKQLLKALMILEDVEPKENQGS